MNSWPNQNPRSNESDSRPSPRIQSILPEPAASPNWLVNSNQEGVGGSESRAQWKINQTPSLKRGRARVRLPISLWIGMKEKKVLRFEVCEPKLRSRESFLDGSCAIKTPDPFFVVRGLVARASRCSRNAHDKTVLVRWPQLGLPWLRDLRE